MIYNFVFTVLPISAVMVYITQKLNSIDFCGKSFLVYVFQFFGGKFYFCLSAVGMD